MQKEGTAGSLSREVALEKELDEVRKAFYSVERFCWGLSIGFGRLTSAFTNCVSTRLP